MSERGHEIAKLQRTIHAQRKHIRAQREGIQLAVEAQRRYSTGYDSMHKELLGAKIQMERMLQTFARLREENTKLLNRNLELEVLHGLTEKV